MIDPVPESVRADDWFGPFVLDGYDVLDRLRVLGGEVVDLVPDCVGMSLTLVDLGVTFTAASSDVRTAVLDGVQYVDGGPCVRAVETGRRLAWRSSDDEQSWRAFAEATAVAGIASTLSLPVVEGERTLGCFNLYARTPDAFEGHHEELAGLLGAWAEGATTNADLGFTTLAAARRAPEVLRDSTRLAAAVGIVAHVTGSSAEAAEERLTQAARRAGVPLRSLVDGIVELLDPRDASPGDDR